MSTALVETEGELKTDASLSLPQAVSGRDIPTRRGAVQLQGVRLGDHKWRRHLMQCVAPPPRGQHFVECTRAVVGFGPPCSARQRAALPYAFLRARCDPATPSVPLVVLSELSTEAMRPGSQFQRWSRALCHRRHRCRSAHRHRRRPRASASRHTCSARHRRRPPRRCRCQVLSLRRL